MTELRDRLQAALGAGYRVEKELGGGGMSRVFLAEEVRLGRRVVVKVLPPEMAAGVSIDRFEREIQLAAKLQHPHVVPLLTAGSADDLLYYIMPFIEGESLRAKLAREGELPVVEVLRILRDVLDALAYAHHQQVVHRDIKPDNVMLSGKHALVTDFGVAKAVAESTGRTALTSMGVALGTPAYMAPEQATADPHTDHRADIYAVGAMAYEMLSGRPPFTGMSAQAVLAAHLTESPEPVTRHRAAVPEAVSALILRCLEKKAADRPQRADELLSLVEAMATPTGGMTPTGTQPVISSGTAAAIERAHPVRVAALFGLASVGVLAIVYALVQVIGLPDWVFWGAIGLLAAGLPIMLLAGRQERQRAVATMTGVQYTTPVGLERHFTWRKALLGGGLAFGGLAATTALFMGLRVLGVGPFATLVSAGVLKERDPLVLAQFANRTGDSTLGVSITEALRIDLSQSPVVRLLENTTVSAALARMQRDPAAPLTEEVAQELAAREGAKAVVAGEVAPLGSGYVLSVRLVSASGDATLHAERETAADASEIIPAVERLSRKLREGIGESLRSIRAAQPLDQVTTNSLAALRLYSEGSRANDDLRFRDAVRPLEQAVALDSNFGMAWRKLGVALGNIGLDLARSRAALTHAYELRHRMPPREALHAEAFPYLIFLNDRRRAIELYERILTTWPDDDIALTNLAISYQRDGRFADAERLYLRSIADGSASGTDYSGLVLVRVAQRRFAAAESTLAGWARRAPENQARLADAAQVAREQGKFDQSFVYVDSLLRSQNTDARVFGFFVAAETYTLRGRLRDAERGTLTQMDMHERAREFNGYLLRALDLATNEALILGRPESAVRRVQAALQRHPLDSIPPLNRPYANLAGFFARAGRADLAQAMLAGFARVAPDSVRNVQGWTHATAAFLALARRDGQAALASLDRAQELFNCIICVDLQRGQAYEILNQPDSAMAMYDRIANTPALGIEARQYQLPTALRRLGEMCEERANREKALEYYGRFADLWKDADPELQPIVAEVKGRMARLVGEGR